MIQDTFLYLLRCGISDTAPDPTLIPHDIDWSEIAEMAVRQTVVGILADAMSRMDYADPVFAQVALNLQMKAYSDVQTNVRMNNVLSELFALFRAKGFDCVLLKGQGVASCYPNPLLRQCGDIDIYVGEDQYQRARQYAHTVLDPKSNADDSHDVHYTFGYKGVSVELHRVALRHEWKLIDRKVQEWTIREMKSGRGELLSIDGIDIKLPSIDFNAFFLFYHIWYHFLFEGVGLRQICDWTLFLRKHRGEIDIEALSDVLRWTHLLKQWQILGCIAVDRLGLAANEMPLYDVNMAGKAEAVLTQIIQSGNFGFYTNGTQVPEHEGIISKFGRVTAFTVRNHFSKFKYDRVLNSSMLISKLYKKTAILIRLLMRK